ncbi:hypothetical protein [Pedobacter lusitanus]|uniref:hypothetical protein n=1 Tax=Pedobacter lusitanus TaxID=1503925 RepID=UPI000AC81AE9|nr:hypothetical protein [Pedobacter lusitanus]
MSTYPVENQLSEKDSVALPAENRIIRNGKYWKRIAGRCLFALAFMIIGHLIASFYPLINLIDAFKAFGKTLDLDAAFGWMLLAGFVAQMVDGALGMGYGVISTTVLLSTGLNPAAISGSIHTAEMFSSGAPVLVITSLVISIRNSLRPYYCPEFWGR